MISLASILAFFTLGSVSWTQKIKGDRNHFYQVQKFKLQQTPETVCYGKAACLLPFA
jgi:hypothetical protein